MQNEDSKKRNRTVIFWEKNVNPVATHNYNLIHDIIESCNGLGWKGPVKIISFQSPTAKPWGI